MLMANVPVSTYIHLHDQPFGSEVLSIVMWLFLLCMNHFAWVDQKDKNVI